MRAQKVFSVIKNLTNAPDTIERLTNKKGKRAPGNTNEPERSTRLLLWELNINMTARI